MRSAPVPLFILQSLLAATFVAHNGCSIVKSVAPPKPATTLDSSTCSSLRGGQIVDNLTKSKFSHIGSLAVVNPAEPNAAARHHCNATLIRPNIAMTTQLFCTSNLNLTDSANVPNFVFTLDRNDPTANRIIKKIHRYRAESGMFRDVALLELEKPFDEKTLDVDFRQQALDANLNTKVTIVGSGGNIAFGDTNAANYSIGIQRFGEAQASGMITANIGGFDAVGLGYEFSSNYLRVLAINNGPINCERDNGAPAFVDYGRRRMVFGIANALYAPGTVGDVGACSAGVTGVYIPSSAIIDWLKQQLAIINPTDVLAKRSIVVARVESIKLDSLVDKLTIKVDNIIDDGLALGNDISSIEFCKSDCAPLSLSTGALKAGLTYEFSLFKVGDVIRVHSVEPVNRAAMYSTKFDATVESVAGEAVINFNRAERLIGFKNIKVAAESPDIPARGGEAVAIRCESGCSQVTQIIGNETMLAPKKGVTVLADVIGDRIFIRSIAANSEFDSKQSTEKGSGKDGVTSEGSEIEAEVDISSAVNDEDTELDSNSPNDSKNAANCPDPA